MEATVGHHHRSGRRSQRHHHVDRTMATQADQMTESRPRSIFGSDEVTQSSPCCAPPWHRQIDQRTRTTGLNSDRSTGLHHMSRGLVETAGSSPPEGLRPQSVGHQSRWWIRRSSAITGLSRTCHTYRSPAIGRGCPRVRPDLSEEGEGHDQYARRDQGRGGRSRLSIGRLDGAARTGRRVPPDKEQLRQDADRLLSGLSERLEDLPALIAENVPGYHPPNPRRGRLLLGLLIGAGAMFLFDPKQGAARRRRIVEKVRGWFSGGQTPSGPYVKG